MSPCWTTFFSLLGVISAVYGTWCAGRAQAINRKGHGASVLRPRLKQAARSVRRYLRRNRREPGAAHTRIIVDPIGITSSVGTPTLSQFDNTIEGRLGSLQWQIDSMRTSADEHLRRAQKAEEQLGQKIREQVTRLDSADAQIEAMTRDVAVGTSGLQLKGLFFVGVGTIFMAIPGVFAFL